MQVTSVNAADLQLHISPYYDSNIEESLATTTGGYGFRVRAKTDSRFTFRQVQIQSGFIAQGYLETRNYAESKVIFVPRVFAAYSLSDKLRIFSESEGLYKRFPDKSTQVRIMGSESQEIGKRYRYWVQAEAGLQAELTSKFYSVLSVQYRPTRVKNIGEYRFHTVHSRFQTRYYLSPDVNVSGGIGYIHIQHHDFMARKLNEQNVLIRSNTPQQDYGVSVTTQIQYRTGIIAGMRLTGESIRSNSVIGKYHQIKVEPYLSGSIGPNFFYHGAFEFSYKKYEHGEYQIIAGYRDPEGPAQNRIHIKLERFLTDDMIGFAQLNIYRNESIIIGRYYDKTIAEMGIELSW